MRRRGEIEAALPVMPLISELKWEADKGHGKSGGGKRMKGNPGLDHSPPPPTTRMSITTPAGKNRLSRCIRTSGSFRCCSERSLMMVALYRVPFAQGTFRVVAVYKIK